MPRDRCFQGRFAVESKNQLGVASLLAAGLRAGGRGRTFQSLLGGRLALMIEHLGKYQILGIIGRGGIGTVYRAFDPVLSRQVALKVVSSEGELSAEQKARLLREGKACAQLTHPNVISVYDLGEDAGRFFIVMELLEGADLRQLIGARATPSLAEKLSLMMQVCDGLHYAHQKGIVHRDIKPGNIFVLPDSRLKILDFGLAYLTTGESSLTPMPVS